MVDFLSSSVQVQREPAQIRSLPTLPTAVPGWVGLTERGPLNTPTSISSFDEFTRIFGGLIASAEVPLGVRQFFLGGGRQGYVARRLGTTPVTSTVTLVDRHAVTPVSTLKLDATSPGIWGNGLSAVIDDPTSGTVGEFNLTILKSGVIVEQWPNLSMTDVAPNFIETVLNNPTTGSIYAVATDLDSATPAPLDIPAKGTFALASGTNGAAVNDATFTGGDNFHILEATPITLLAVPDQPTTAVQVAMAVFAEVTRSREVFCVFDPPVAANPSGILAHKLSIGSSEQGALYWPNIKIPNPSKLIFGSGDTITVPPSGAVMGMMARNDNQHSAGSFRQPAGVEDGVLYGIVGVEYADVARKSVRDLVYPKRVNPIRVNENAGGVYVDGSRTCKGDGDFPSVGESRGIGDLERTFRIGLDFVRHRNNNEETRGIVERTMRGELLERTRNKCFASTKPSEAFTLDADIDGVGLNNAIVRAQNRLYARFGIATAKPAEFVVLLASQDTRALQEAVSS